MTSPIAAPVKQAYTLIEFKHGPSTAPHYERYTDFTADKQDQFGNVYKSSPNLEIKYPKNTGAFNEAPLVLVMELDTFLSRLSNGEPHSPCFVSLFEVTEPLDTAQAKDFLTTYRGRLAKTIQNYQGKSTQVGLEVVNLKDQVKVPMGFPCGQQCPWTFGGPGCGYNVAAKRETGPVTAVNRRLLTVTGLTLPSAGYWRRGFMEYDGLRIAIRDWVNTNPTVYTMMTEIPADWLGKTVTATPGCDKTIAICRGRWSNEDHYGGSGYMMPIHHPIYESQ